jgi:membrane dipeptidase
MIFKTADAHCDTLYAYKDKPFNNPGAAWNIEKFKKVNGIFQCFAICVLSPNHSDSAMREAVSTLGNFYRQKPDEINLLLSSKDFREDKINAILALEGASPIIDDINNLYAYHKLGVRLITLTWNHRNFVADGVSVGANAGITEFGRQVIKEMEKLKIIVDVSHLNERGFKDLCEIATKPFIASHSNAFSVMPHSRNLKDYQIEEIVNRKGFIGINFYSDFIAESGHLEILIDKLLEHVSYFLDKGAKDVLGLGADFDGIDRSPFEDVSGYEKFADLLSTRLNLSDGTIEKIMSKNLIEYILKML